jgi:hypothetical protein
MASIIDTPKGVLADRINALYSSLYNTEYTANKGKHVTKVSDMKVYGLPQSYSQLADPHGRVFRKTIIANMPIVSICPGKVISSFAVNSKDPEDKAVQNNVKQKLLELQKWNTEDPEGEHAKESLLNAYNAMQESGKNLPYLMFQSDTKGFNNVYTTLAQRVLSRISLDMANPKTIDAQNQPGFFTSLWNDIKQVASSTINKETTANWTSTSWLNFYMDKATSMTEGGQNTWGDSMMSMIGKKFSGISNEVQTLLGAGQLASTDQKETTDNSGIFGKMASAMQGEQVIFPKIWQDSTFTRTYNLAFRFETPYGDPISIWRHVYQPFLALLAMSLPRQQGLSSYSSPFVVRVDAPGFFTIDAGLIGNISIKKGECGWSNDGLPLSIDVNLDVEDMYPTLMLSGHPAVLSTNFGLCAYLDSMTGISYVDSLTGGSLKSSIKASIARAIAAPVTFISDVESTLIRNVRDISMIFLPKS